MNQFFVLFKFLIDNHCNYFYCDKKYWTVKRKCRLACLKFYYLLTVLLVASWCTLFCYFIFHSLMQCKLFFHQHHCNIQSRVVIT